jgi:uncharacterized protein YqeY
MILEKIKADNLTARKAKDKFTSSVLTTLIGEISIVGKNDGNRETTDEECIAKITKFKKGVAETVKVLHSSQGNWPDEYDKELALYEKYLPTLMTEVELQEVIKGIVAKTLKPNIGSVMKELKENYKHYDGKMASTILKDVLC